MKETLCPHCQSKEVIKWCKRKTENRGLIQRYKCNDCQRYFTINDGFFRMRNSPQKITQSIDLFYRGVSTRKVQEHLAIFFPHNASHSSVYNWVIKYAKMISNYTRKLQVQVGEEVQVDEVEFQRRKSHNGRGKETNWLIDSIDPETRFMVASGYGRTRGKKEIKAVMQNIKDKTGSQVKVLTTDGWYAYRHMEKVWGFNSSTKRYNIIHNRVNASQGEGFNYPIERLHNNIRARTNIMRGFHGSIHSADIILKGFEIYHNFITKHQGIKCYPYELAIPQLKEQLQDKNRWLGLIRLSCA